MIGTILCRKVRSTKSRGPANSRGRSPVRNATGTRRGGLRNAGSLPLCARDAEARVLERGGEGP